MTEDRFICNFGSMGARKRLVAIEGTACLKRQLSAILRCCVFHPADADRSEGTPVDPSGNSGGIRAGRFSPGRETPIDRNRAPELKGLVTPW